jgi:30S ribosomal protein 3
VAAAATEETVETEGAVDDLAEEQYEAEAQEQTPISKRPSASTSEGMEYALNVLWNEQSLAVGVDQVFSKDSRAPVTEYFFWPRNDAWDDCKAGIEKKPWISEKEKVELLNALTDIINAWGDEPRPTLAEVQERFPEHYFK